MAGIAIKQRATNHNCAQMIKYGELPGKSGYSRSVIGYGCGK
jgi:hypothetical protein